MSFVPQPQRQNANNTTSNTTNTVSGSNNNNSNQQNAVISTTGAATTATPVDDAELIFNIRTFDLYFVDRAALMYKDGIAKVRDWVTTLPFFCYHSWSEGLRDPRRSMSVSLLDGFHFS